MCGITGIINIKKSIHTVELQKATSIIQHRGPDDEGFLLWNGEAAPVIYSGHDTVNDSKQFHNLSPLPGSTDWKVGFGHRRLSIVDLSPAGHQPMIDQATGIAVSYNGEVYNYKEIRPELEALGHRFVSHSDTEVILKAWVQWGPACVNKFNGMFGILILDPRNGGKLYAIRDRFGVKPVYWTKTQNYFAFASEIKQLKILSDFKTSLNQDIAYDYLAYGQLDHTNQTFDNNIHQLRGGQMMSVNLHDNSFKIEDWYTLPTQKWEGTDKEAIDKFEELLTDSVRLRLRADVTVGSCLSGGLDSSAIVCLMEKVLRGQPNNGIKTITACFDNKKYDEWEYAETVVKQTGAQAHRVFPSFNNLQEDLEKLLWHMDEPFGSTSQFSQWSVFKGAAEAGLKVMLDGQGSDEQLAGYGGNDLPLYAGLLKNLRFAETLKEASAYQKTYGNYPKSQLIGAARRTWPAIDPILPKSWKTTPATHLPVWLNQGYKPVEGNLEAPRSLRDTLIHQTLYTSLPVLLKYEDRNSMAWSIESRVPFLDYRFVEFNLNLPEHLTYHKGVRKHILREAMRNTFPQKIYERRDKMGFVTPEEVWLKGEGKDWFHHAIDNGASLAPALIEKQKAGKQVDDLLAGKANFDFSYWRLACIGNWLK